LQRRRRKGTWLSLFHLSILAISIPGRDFSLISESPIFPGQFGVVICEFIDKVSILIGIVRWVFLNCRAFSSGPSWDQKIGASLNFPHQIYSPLTAFLFEWGKLFFFPFNPS